MNRRIFSGRLFASAALAAVCAALASCGGILPPPLPPDAVAVNDMNKKGSAAYQKGDFEKAVRFHEEALRHCMAMDDVACAARELLNMAIIHRKKGDTEAAIRTVTGAFTLAGSELAIGAPREPGNEMLYEPLAGAALLMGLVALDKDDTAGAQRWTYKSLGLCKAAKCRFTGRIHNVMARVHANKGDRAAAMDVSRRALAASKREGDRAETANAYRLLGELADDADRALTLLGQALIIDRSLGLGEKISMDLAAMGAAHGRKGDEKQAALFFRRALAVSRAAGDETGIKRAAALLENAAQR